MAYRDLTPGDAQRELQRDASLRILDVRTAPEHQSHRLPGSVLIPVQELAQRVHELDTAGNWLVLCEHGRRSLVACAILEAAGFAKLANLRGGLSQWLGEGLPCTRGR